MNKIIFIFWMGFCFFNSLALAKPPEGKPVQLVLTSFEAPPFFSDSLPDQGAAAHAIKKVYAELGYGVVIKIYPIRRAHREAMTNPLVAGFAPSSQFDDLEGLTLTKPTFQTQTMILQNRKKPIDISKLENLRHYRGGNVRGYFLKGPLKEMKAAGKLKLEEAPSNISNITKLAEGRLDYALINDSMYSFLRATEPRLAEALAKVEPSGKPVVVVNWSAALKASNPVAAKALKDFNEKGDVGKFKEYTHAYLKQVLLAKQQGGADGRKETSSAKK